MKSGFRELVASMSLLEVYEWGISPNNQTINGYLLDKLQLVVSLQTRSSHADVYTHV